MEYYQYQQEQLKAIIMFQRKSAGESTLKSVCKGRGRAELVADLVVVMGGGRRQTCSMVSSDARHPSIRPLEAENRWWNLAAEPPRTSASILA